MRCRFLYARDQARYRLWLVSCRRMNMPVDIEDSPD